ncbi:TonB family protein [Polycladidibacter hongkongensis]|uniref:TonB family protein n=1 Tax=Polycladidibacter hongkongensis TaxID=1647556 RepID=UPI00082C1A76|nr:TonB family protein [Pseudovibrio hongkongensis]
MQTSVKSLSKWSLAIAFVISSALHAGTSLSFVEEEEKVEIAAAAGMDVAVVGSLEDLVAGNKANISAAKRSEPKTAPPKKLKPLKEPKKLKKAELKQIQPAAEPLEEPLKAPVEQVEGIRLDAAKQHKAAKPVKPVAQDNKPKPVKPEDTTAAKPVEVAQSEKAEPVKAIKTKVKPVTKPKPKKVARAPQKKGAKLTQKKGQAGQAKRATQGGSKVNTGVSAQAGNAARDNYKGSVQRKIRNALEREVSRRRRYSKLYGEVVFSFTIDRSGGVLKAAIIKGSGKAAFDKLALKAASRASFKAVPREIPAPIKFSLTFRRGRR